jgi:hypothetical protein
MIRKLVILLSCVCVTLIADAGGIPARPKFQAVTVTSGALTTSGTVSTTASAPSVSVGKSGTDAYVTMFATAAANTGRWDIQASGGGTLNVRAVNDAYGTASNAFSAGRSGATLTTVSIGNATDNPAVSVNGRALPKFTYAVVFGNSGTTCTLQSFSNQNVSSCVRASSVAGRYQLNFTSAYTTAPTCTAIIDLTAGGTSATVVQLFSQPTTTSVVFQVQTTAGTVTDQVLYVTCMGT